MSTCPQDYVCVSASCLVFRKLSIFMIQLLHKLQIWFSVFLAEPLREGGGGEATQRGEREIQADKKKQKNKW